MYAASLGDQKEAHKLIYDQVKAAPDIVLQKKETFSNLLERVIQYLDLIDCQCITCVEDLFFTAIHGFDEVLRWDTNADRSMNCLKEIVLKWDNYRPHINPYLIC